MSYQYHPIDNFNYNVSFEYIIVHFNQLINHLIDQEQIFYF